MGSCCTPDHSCSTGAESAGGTAVAVAETVTVTDTTTAYAVSGMTCGHCRTAITGAVGALPGGAPDDAAIAAAVDDAGYELTGRA
ncbi:cation transporter [Streptomyces cinereoruber]|uniref:cation transporter n=1 Tax=Streptomyces cinereoruber TaxID=67260 RepID=UPI003C2B91F6